MEISLLTRNNLTIEDKNEKTSNQEEQQKIKTKTKSIR